MSPVFGPIRPVLLILALALSPPASQAQQRPLPPAAKPADQGLSPLSPNLMPYSNGLATPSSSRLRLMAVFGPQSRKPVMSDLNWNVFEDRPNGDGSYKLILQSSDPLPQIELPNGDYIVHVSYGLASSTRRISLNGSEVTEAIALNAGALKVTSLIGDAPIAPNRTMISVFVPDRGNAEGKLVASNVKAGDILRLPEGTYHIVSTYLDAASANQAPSPTAGMNNNATNSIVDADAKVQIGKLTEAILRHRVAVITLKLVNFNGGEALANTSFTVLTPGGDVLREMIGAFPSLPLAEGEYVVIARRDGKAFQRNFNVVGGHDTDIEVLFK
ncbi:MAG: hypothetical protein EBY21_07855 [Alphaproteobacteria bacterium]|nr:hypothetical protein [Alphaproteobacteria bacterium]